MFRATKAATRTTGSGSKPVSKSNVEGGECDSASWSDDGVFNEAMEMLKKMSLNDIASAQQELAQAIVAEGCVMRTYEQTNSTLQVVCMCK